MGTAPVYPQESLRLHSAKQCGQDALRCCVLQKDSGRPDCIPLTGLRSPEAEILGFGFKTLFTKTDTMLGVGGENGQCAGRESNGENLLRCIEVARSNENLRNILCIFCCVICRLIDENLAESVNDRRLCVELHQTGIQWSEHEAKSR